MKNNINSYFKSGTDAFDKVFKELNFPNNSEIIVPVTLCNSVVECIIRNGLKPVFSDVDNSFLITNFEDKISKKTKAIIFVEQYGFAYDLKKEYYNKNKERIVNIIDSCQANIKKHNKCEYTVYSFNKNKPIDLGGYSLVVSNHRVNNSVTLSKMIYIKLFLKKITFNFKFLKRKYISFLIKKRIKIPGIFVKAKNNSLHRIVFIMDIDNNNFNRFDDLLYKYLNDNKCNLVETTIEESPFELLNVKNTFYNFTQLRSKTLYFRPTGKIKNYIKLIDYINEVFYEKI